MGHIRYNILLGISALKVKFSCLQMSQKLTKRDQAHEEDLDSTSQKNRQEHSFPRCTEDVAVHQLPSEFLLRILLQAKFKIRE